MTIDLLNSGDSDNKAEKVLCVKCPKCGGIYRKLTTCGIVVEHIECCPFGKRMKVEALRYAEMFKKGGGGQQIPPSETADRTSAKQPLPPPKPDTKIKCEKCKTLVESSEVNEFGFCKECNDCEYCGGLRLVTYGDREIACEHCRREPDLNDIGD